MTSAPALTAATGSPASPPFAGGPSPATGRRCQRLSQRKEGLIDVGGHVVGGAANDPRKGALRPRPQQLTAFQASVQKGDSPSPRTSPHPREQYPVMKAPVAVLSAALARRDPDRSGLQPPAAGGGLSRVSPARTIPQTKTGRDALNVPA